ncbi:hypothetical protein ABE073_04970 [Lederbergia citrisecunda]|uniref:hypothetical protein n=1 Tax=Lederbergia citrisecunda TaxID=2833583 RepID=UPI003D294F72
MNKFFKENEYTFKATINLLILTIIVATSTFFIMNTLERTKQHNMNMAELKQENEKQQDLRIKQELLHDEMLNYYYELKKLNKKMEELK